MPSHYTRLKLKRRQKRDREKEVVLAALPVGEPTPASDLMELETRFSFIVPNDTPNGTYLSRNEIDQECPTQQKLAYKVEATFENVVFLLTKYGWLAAIDPEIKGNDITIISKAYNGFRSIAKIGSNDAAMLAALPHLAKIDFSNLKEPRLKYVEQKSIPQDRIANLAAYASYYDLDLGVWSTEILRLSLQ